MFVKLVSALLLVLGKTGVSKKSFDEQYEFGVEAFEEIATVEW